MSCSAELSMKKVLNVVKWHTSNEPGTAFSGRLYMRPAMASRDFAGQSLNAQSDQSSLGDL